MQSELQILSGKKIRSSEIPRRMQKDECNERGIKSKHLSLTRNSISSFGSEKGWMSLGYGALVKRYCRKDEREPGHVGHIFPHQNRGSVVSKDREQIVERKELCVMYIDTNICYDSRVNNGRINSRRYFQSRTRSSSGDPKRNSRNTKSHTNATETLDVTLQ